jgi:hypothetical protein
MATCLSFHAEAKSAVLKSFSALTRFSLWVAVGLALSTAARAQSRFTQAEVFGGYSHLGMQTGDFGFGSWTQLNGFHVALSLPHIVKGLGATAEASGDYSTPIEQYLYAIGPQYKWEFSRFLVIAHGLYGKAQTRVRQPGSTFIEPSDRQRALIFGGEVDLPISKRFSWRILQGDAILTTAFGESQRNIRVSTGLIYMLGKR